VLYHYLEDFTLRCMGWEDDGTDPVEYEFRYYNPTTVGLCTLNQVDP
jgi:hypothetical protein